MKIYFYIKTHCSYRPATKQRGEGGGATEGEQGEAASPAGADTRGEGGSEEH